MTAVGDRLNLGLLLEERGDLAEAERRYRQAANAGQSRAMTDLGVLLRKRGERAEAEEWYQKAARSTTQSDA